MSVPAPAQGASARRPPAALGYAASALLAAIAGGIAAGGAENEPTAVAFARAATVGAPLAVGFHMWRGRRAARLGAALMLLGATWLLTTAAESQQSGWYVFGRTAGWFTEILLVYLALAFPHGRLEHPLDRVLVAATALTVALFFLPLLLVAEQLPLPSAYTSCTQDCPANPLFIGTTEDETLVAILRSAGALTAFTIDLAIVARLWQRMAGARSVTRQMLQPVLMVAAVRAALLGIGMVARQVAPDAPALELVAWAVALGTPALALAFLIGLVRSEIFAGGVLKRLNSRGPAAAGMVGLERELARDFLDPRLRLAFPDADGRGGWFGAEGRPFAPPEPGSPRRMIEVRHGDEVVAAIVCHEDLLLHPALLEAASSLVSLMLDNRRLTSDAERSLQELEASRARLLTSAERERRRIERDLHDGAQQRLVALRLELAAEMLPDDPEAGRERLRQLERDVDEALEELRSIAHGVYPPVLADHGLAEAIRAVALRMPVRVDLEEHNVCRYAAELESALYFCMLEALQNALKHAKGVRRIAVVLEADGAELRFSVRDDGAGAANGALCGGQGITGMRDRLAAFGGRLDVSSAVDVGTTVRGAVPLRAVV